MDTAQDSSKYCSPLMIQYPYKRIEARLPIPGVFEVSRTVPIGLAIANILLISEHSLKGE